MTRDTQETGSKTWHHVIIQMTTTKQVCCNDATTYRACYFPNIIFTR